MRLYISLSARMEFIYFSEGLMKEFHTKHKHHIRLWIVLALITIISGIIAYDDKRKESEIESANIEQPEKKKIVYNNLDNPSITTTEELSKEEIKNTVETIGVVLEIEEQQYPIQISPGGSAYDLMLIAKEQGLMSFSSRDYGGDLGQLIEEINGIKNSVREKKYWIYYINGQKAQIGISNYHPNAHDIISWKYEDETI